MRVIPTLLALTLSAVPLAADEASDRATTLAFITENQIDRNLYNLLAATIPSTQAGQAMYEACGPKVLEDLFENAYSNVRKTMGEVWRGALADVYSRHVSVDEMKELTTLPQSQRMTAISERMTQEDVVADLQGSLTPLVEEATARQVNHMIDEAETLCMVAE